MPDWIVWLMGVGGPLSFVATIATLINSRRKVSAEAADIYRRAAGGMMQDLHVELEYTRQCMGALQDHLQRVEELLRAQNIAVPTFRYPPRPVHNTNGHTA